MFWSWGFRVEGGCCVGGGVGGDDGGGASSWCRRGVVRGGNGDAVGGEDGGGVEAELSPDTVTLEVEADGVGARFFRGGDGGGVEAELLDAVTKVADCHGVAAGLIGGRVEGGLSEVVTGMMVSVRGCSEVVTEVMEAPRVQGRLSEVVTEVVEAHGVGAGVLGGGDGVNRGPRCRSGGHRRW